MRRFFAENGPLAAELPAYLLRTAQLDMALAIVDCLNTERGRLVVEAGTGTGKSLAYLAAALLSDKKVLISTATKTLQDQLFHKDLPLAMKIAEQISGKRKRALMMKGRGNYLCLDKADEWSPTGELFRARDNDLMDRLRVFMKTTQTGDRAEMKDLPDDFAPWSEISAKADTCLGQECSQYQDCFVTQMRRSAQSADILIVNHSLLCADRSLRVSGTDAAFSPIIPDTDLWIIDEAHALVDVATRHFGVSITGMQVKALMRDLAQALPGQLKLALDELPALFSKLFETAPRQTDVWQNIAEHLRFIDVKLIAAAGDVSGERKSLLNALSRRVNELTTELVFMLSDAASKAGYVTYAERDNRGGVLSASPIDVAQVLSHAFWSCDASMVMTSATLAVSGKMDAFIRQSGLAFQHNDEVKQHIWAAPFDFKNQAALYVPNISEPSDPNFQAQMEDEIKSLVAMSKGGAFLLFTSHRAMNLTYDNLKDVFEAQGLTVFKQGDAPKLELLRQFTEADQTWGAVLFATHSFWEGVDVRGKALRMVIIDRVPFKSPEDPVVKARTERLQKEGLSSFALMSLPEAALTLKQGAGRLIRTHQDAGVVALLDSRLFHKNYGKTLLATLPPMTLVRQRDELAVFWKEHVTSRFNHS